MATMTLSEVLDRFDDAIAVDADYERSRWLYAAFGSDARSYLHKAYAISTPTSLVSDFDERGHYGSQGESLTTVLVKVSYRIRGDAQWEDYKAALESEQTVARLLLAQDRTYDAIRYRATESRETTLDGGWLFSVLRFDVHHRLAFT